MLFCHQVCIWAVASLCPASNNEVSPRRTLTARFGTPRECNSTCRLPNCRSMSSYCWQWGCRRVSVGHGGRRRRFPDDAAADLHRCSPAGRGGDRRQSDHRGIGFGSVGALAPRQRRLQDGAVAAGRRRCRLVAGRVAVLAAEKPGPDRSCHLAQLHPVPVGDRHPDGRGKRAHPVAKQSRRAGESAMSIPGCMACR